MGGSSCKQAPPWVARATIANATSPLPILSQLRLENVIACIEKYRAQAQTALVLDAGSLEDLCDDFVSDCRHFAKFDFRKQLVTLYTNTSSQAVPYASRSFQPGSTGADGAATRSTASGSSASSPPDIIASPGGVNWKEDSTLSDAGEERSQLGHVDCRQVFASLILIASGPLEAKVEYLVKLFCWTEQQEIEALAVYLLLVAAVRGMSLLTQNVPPSDVLLAEVLERVDTNAECTENDTSFVFDKISKRKFVVNLSVRDENRSLGLEADARPSEIVQEKLQKCAFKVWELNSVVAALAGDIAVREYYDVVTKIFLRGQIEEQLSDTVQNFRLALQRVANPAASQEAEKPGFESRHSAGQRAFSVGRVSALKKKHQTVEVVEFDLVPLPWKHIDAILRFCMLKHGVTTRLLDELQCESRAACQDLGIEWKKWLDEPIQDTLNNANLAELLPPPRKELAVAVASQSVLSGHPEDFRRESRLRTDVTSLANVAASSQVGPASTHPTRQSSATLRELFRSPAVQAAGSTHGRSVRGSLPSAVDSAAPADAGTNDANAGELRGTKEYADPSEHTGVKANHWKFAYSSGPYMWSDDVQLIMMPLFAFCAIDCHGDGVIAARHLDLLFHLLKVVDPVRGGFFSRLEKVLAADTRALFSFSLDALDPFCQLRKVLSRQRQEVRLLSFAVAVSICAIIQDRRHHENTLASKFKRFDLEQSGSISRSGLEVLLLELIKDTVKIQDSGTGYDKALQAVVDKTINAFVQPTAERVEFNIYLRAHDRIRKNNRKLKAEIIELAAEFEGGLSISRQSSPLSRTNSQKTRRSSSMLRMNSRSGLRRSSKMRSNSKNAVADNNRKSILGRK